MERRRSSRSSQDNPPCASREMRVGSELIKIRPHSRQTTIDACGDATQNPSLREHFENLKEWISEAYYSSEAWMRGLGCTENRVFEKIPGCEHPEGHH